MTTNFEQRRLPANLEITLYRFVQEALTNAARYAGASEVEVLLHLRTDAVVALVQDDGIGFDPDRLLEGEHLGLLGIQERVAAMNGELTIESAPGRGTNLHVEIPLASA